MRPGATLRESKLTRILFFLASFAATALLGSCAADTVDRVGTSKIAGQNSAAPSSPTQASTNGNALPVVDKGGTTPRPPSGNSPPAEQAPRIRLTSVPEALVTARQQAVAFTTDSPMPPRFTTRCSVDRAAFQICDQVVSLIDLSDGPHSVTIQMFQAVDGLGGVLSPLAEQQFVTFTVDATAPSVTINRGPGEAINLTEVEFSFTPTDAVSGVAATECSFNDGEFVSCVSPRIQTDLVDGTSYSLRLRGRDKAGNTSEPVAVRWVVDRTVPDAVVITTSPPALDNQTTTFFEFAALDNGTAVEQFECQIDADVAKPCAAQTTFGGLAAGPHTLRVVSVDKAGNRSSAQVYSWKIDTVSPSVVMIERPEVSTILSVARFVFSATDNDSGVAEVTCQLDTIAAVPCLMDDLYTGLTLGKHVFSVRARDAAGNLAIETYGWEIIAPPTP